MWPEHTLTPSVDPSGSHRNESEIRKQPVHAYSINTAPDLSSPMFIETPTVSSLDMGRTSRDRSCNDPIHWWKVIMLGYHMFQHVYPKQPAGGLHNRVVWAEARQLPLLRIKLKYPTFLLWKLVSFKNVLGWNRKFTHKWKTNLPVNRSSLLILNISMTSLLCLVRIVHWDGVWPQRSDDRKV